MKGLITSVAASAVILLSFSAGAQQPAMFKKCQACHGKKLTGKKKNPSIADRSYEELYASLTTKVPKKMKRIANKLTDEQKSELSKYIFNLRERNERQ